MAGQEIQEIIDMINKRAADMAGQEVTFHDRRRMMDADGEQLQDLSGVTVTSVDVEGIPAELVVADNADSSRTILYVHGGGYVIGSLTSHRGLVADLSKASNSRVLNLDYRLAPEATFPAPVDDTVAAYKWLLANGATPENTAIAGDSAGGGLAVAALVAIKDSGLPIPGAGLCLSPWVDMEGTSDSFESRSHLDPSVQRAGILAFAGMYLDGADPKSPLASPIHADLSGLPPLIIQVGTSETLYDDAIWLRDAATKAGVDVTFEVWEGMIHVWHRFASKVPDGKKAIDNLGKFVQVKLGAGVASAD